MSTVHIQLEFDTYHKYMYYVKQFIMQMYILACTCITIFS